MSRIDKALQRAFSAPARQHAPADPCALDEYPSEGPDPAGGDISLSSVRTRDPDPPPPLGRRAPVHPAPQEDPPAVSIETLDRLPQCRRLAGLLQERRANDPFKVIAVTRAEEAEATAPVTLSLAAALARVSGGRVLLVDSDSRPPFVHDVLGVSNGAGWSDLLENEASHTSLVSAGPLLHVLTVGHRPQAIGPGLGSPDCRGLLDACGTAYEWVLLNAPAVSVLREPRLLARHADGVVFVIGRSTPFPLVERSLAALGRERVVGTVLIGLDDRLLP